MSSNMTSDILYKIEKKALQYQASEPADSLSTLEKAISPELSVVRAVGDTELNMKDIYVRAKNKTCDIFLYTYIADSTFWPPLQAINFTYVPVRYQVLYLNFACFVWNIFLSSMAHL